MLPATPSSAIDGRWLGTVFRRDTEIATNMQSPRLQATSGTHIVRPLYNVPVHDWYSRNANIDVHVMIQHCETALRVLTCTSVSAGRHGADVGVVRRRRAGGVRRRRRRRAQSEVRRRAACATSAADVTLTL